MKIDERFLIEAPIDPVWAFVRNPQTAAPCIPGCEAVEPLSDKLYRSTSVVVEINRRIRSLSSSPHHIR
jgi:carbon monoxide dehydrogenase subunit G